MSLALGKWTWSVANVSSQNVKLVESDGFWAGNVSIPVKLQLRKWLNYGLLNLRTQRMVSIKA